MIKNFLKSGFFLLAFSAVAFAQEPGPFNTQDLSYPAPDQMDSFIATKVLIPQITNAYMGIQGGGTINQLNLSSDVIAKGMETVDSASKDIVTINGGLFGGYGENFGHLYVGGELGAYYNSLSKDNVFPTNIPDFAPSMSLNVEQPVILALDFMPGYLTSPYGVLFYGRVGVAESWIHMNFSNNPVYQSHQVSDTADKFSTGFRIGGGVDYYFTDWFSLRADYVYSIFKKVRATFVFDFPDFTTTQSVRLSSHQLDLGMNFHF